MGDFNKVAIVSFFGGVALEIFQLRTPTPQKNATLFWDERSVWWPLKACKQQFLGSVVIILRFSSHFPLEAPVFGGAPGPVMSSQAQA